MGDSGFGFGGGALARWRPSREAGGTYAAVAYALERSALLQATCLATFMTRFTHRDQTGPSVVQVRVLAVEYDEQGTRAPRATFIARGINLPFRTTASVIDRFANLDALSDVRLDDV